MATSPELEVWDPLNSPSAPGLHWTTVNAGEAIPGVQTPLSWTFWERTSELTTRAPSHRVGAMTQAEAQLPDSVDGRLVRVFYGRAAIQVEVLKLLGDRLPGTTGPEAIRHVLGHVPEDVEFHPTRRRYPIVAARLPWLYLTVPRSLPKFNREYEIWRRASLPRIPNLDRPALASLIADARQRHERGVLLQTDVLFCAVQPMFDALSRLVEDAGVGDLSILSGSGGAEMAVVADIWRASRGEIGIETVVENHGFHGHKEGELSSRVWREDDRPLQQMIERYAQRDDSEAPAIVEADAERRRMEQTQAVLAALPRGKRPGARILLAQAHRKIPLRGVAKRGFLGAFDVGRAAARRTGELLADEGVLEQPDDVFFLTFQEVTGALPPNAAELVALRRERRGEYQGLTLPVDWRGEPTPIPLSGQEDVATAGEVLSGIGVSGGTVEGIVHVVQDPATADVQQDEILVAPITDPSWSSVMFISSALVVDVGGALSHAAVVARELEIPCVVNTGNGSTALRTGDRVRVDGDAGTVEVLERAAG